MRRLVTNTVGIANEAYWSGLEQLAISELEAMLDTLPLYSETSDASTVLALRKK